MTRNLALCALVFASACTDNSSTGPTADHPMVNDAIVHIPVFIKAADGSAPTDPNTPLYETRKGNPILAPDGHQVTLGEFQAPTGAATVSCGSGGTTASVTVHGLLPRGVYTFWNVVFKAPGFDPTFANLIGLGAIGAANGSQNVVTASAAGDATITATTPGGTLSMMGAIGACAPVDSFEWHLVGAYHIDGMSHGATLGPDGTAVEQLGFAFKRAAS